MPYFVWEPSARAALRAIPRLQAQQILMALNQYARSAQGDVTLMKGNLAGACACAAVTIGSSSENQVRTNTRSSSRPPP
jgi:hypothetical protein